MFSIKPFPTGGIWMFSTRSFLTGDTCIFNTRLFPTGETRRLNTRPFPTPSGRMFGSWHLPTDSIRKSGTRLLRRTRQHGFALLELTIAMALVCMLAIWAADKLLHDVNNAAEQASGLWLLDIRRALDGLLARHGDALSQGRAPADQQGKPFYTDPWSPTLAELKAHGHLASAFPDRGPLGLHAVIRVWREGACPGIGCRLNAVAYSAAPVLRARSGQPDFSRIAGITLATDGAGGSVSELAPHRLRGAAFDLPNPPAPGMARLPVGTVAVRADREAVGYLRQRDTRNPEFLGDVSSAGTLSTNGRLVAGEHLKLGGAAVPGQPCPDNGLLAREANGSLLNCVAGVWSVPGGFGGAYATNNGLCAVQNPTVKPQLGPGANAKARLKAYSKRCSCPPGFQTVQVSAGGVTGHEGPGWTRGYVCVR